MSDDEYEYEYASDGGYDYSDNDADEDGGENDEKIEVENAFYEGEEAVSENRRTEAIEKFETVVTMETSRASRGTKIENRRFKALEHLVKIHFEMGNHEHMVSRYKEMLEDMQNVTRNDCTEAINAVLEMLSAGSDFVDPNGGRNVMVAMFEITLNALKNANNERLWFNTNLRLAKLYLDLQRIAEVESLLSVLKSSCQTPDGKDDPSKGSNLLEVYCMEIQLCTLTQNNARMRQVYPRTVHLNAAVADPRIMGVIREEGGKMHMAEGGWDEAYNELYEAFRCFQEAGNTLRAKTCLKYVVLSSMLAVTSINPFAAREAKVFAEDREVLAMSNLRQSLEANDLSRFERVLQDKQNHICDEPIIMSYIEPLRHRMREQVVLSITRPYKVMTLQFLGAELSLGVREAEKLLVDMILENKISAHIDQIKGTVVLGGGLDTVSEKKMRSIGLWADGLAQAHGSSKVNLQF